MLAAALVSALIATAVLDSPVLGESKPRASLFPAALAILDPMLGLGLRNSALAALIVTVGSVLIGLPLARGIARWRFWMRQPLAVLTFATLAVPPLVTALGLRRLLRTDELSILLPLGYGETMATGGGLGGGWLALVWAGLVRGVPLITLVVSQALRRVDPLWEDASRAAGASSWALWRSQVRPLIRGSVARGAAAVFGLTLLDPGAPLVLDLRRTVGYQLALGVAGGEPARTAVLAMLGAALAIAATVLARLTGADLRALPPRSRPRRATWRRAPWLVAMLLVWLAVAWLPLAGLLQDYAPNPAIPRLDLAGSLAGPGVRQAVRDSCILGLVVATLGLLAAIGAGPPGAAQRRLASPWGSAAAVMLVPMAVAFAILPIPLRALAEAGSLAWLGRAARWVDPMAVPGVALALALTAAWTPALAEALTAAHDRWRPEFTEAAVALGASRRRAWWDLAWPLMAPPVARAWVMAACGAACDASAALLLDFSDRFRPIGPAILALWNQPGGAGTAVALAVVGGAACALASSVGLSAADRQEGPSRAG
jgi:ABC-type Fe3+ transport system permease subunit